MTYSSESKGTGPKNAKYAHGGKCFNSVSRFIKAPDTFRDDNEITDYKKVGKGGSMSKTVEKKA
jgi:hypothetical protein